MPELTQILDEHKRSLATEILRRGGGIRVRAWGASMLPVIWPGDILKIEDLKGEAEIGDIVLVERGQRFFVHRVVQENRDCWIVRGDALWRSDPAVSRSQLLGKVTMICRPDSNSVRPARLSVVKRLVGLVLGEFDFARNFVLRLYTRKRVDLAIEWSAGDLPV